MTDAERFDFEALYTGFVGPDLVPDGLTAIICRRLGKLPDEVNRQRYSEMIRTWQLIQLMDQADAAARE